MSPSRIEATTLIASSQRREDPKKLAAAASDFEALLLSQLMKSAREAASPSPDGEAGGSCDSIMELAEQQFGHILASAGGLGIAKLAVSGMTPKDTGAAAKDR
jgi:Rod binding domain-containing protein